MANSQKPLKVGEFLDFNLLPDHYLRRKLPFRAVLYWSLVVALAALFIPTRMILVNATIELRSAEENLMLAETIRESFSPVSDEAEALNTTVEEATSTADALEQAFHIVNVRQIVWHEVLLGSLEILPDRVEIQKVDQIDNMIHLQGLAYEYQAPLAFADRLKSWGRFSSVNVESLQQLRFADTEAELETLGLPNYEFVISLNLGADTNTIGDSRP